VAAGTVGVGAEAFAPVSRAVPGVGFFSTPVSDNVGGVAGGGSVLTEPESTLTRRAVSLAGRSRSELQALSAATSAQLNRKVGPVREGDGTL